MKTFYRKTLLFLLAIFTVILIVFMLADGTSDAYYQRFKSPAQSSLILGTSRAAQAIQPAILHEVLIRKNISNKFFNYAFTNENSPYGPAYFRSIQKKLDPKTENGIFIIEVSPWSLCERAENINDSVLFRETDLFLDKLNYVNINPNIFYLLKFYQNQYFQIILNKIEKPIVVLHDDGWLEVNIPFDDKLFAKALNGKVKKFEAENLGFYHFNNIRFNYLIKTITYLQNHGKVFLVRLPVHQEILNIENKSVPDFNSKIIDLSKTLNVSYLDLTTTSEDYKYTDGNHIHKSSSAKVTEKIAEWIIKEY